MRLWRTLQKRHIGRRIFAVVLVVSVGFSCYLPVAASVVKDAQSKKNEAQENLNEINQKINDIHAAQNNLQTEMAGYDRQLMSLLTDMEILKSDMGNKEIEIQEANAALDVAKLEEAYQYESMKKRIQYMYENGEQSIWMALMAAEDITDLLNRVEYVSEVYDADRKLLGAYQDTVQQVADLTLQLENEMTEMEELQISYQEQQSSLEQVISQKRTVLADFDNQLANAESLAGQYATTIREQNQIIANEKARQAALQAQKNANKQNNTSGAGKGNASSGKNPAVGGGTVAAGGTTAGQSNTVDQGTVTGGSSSSNSGSGGLTDSSLNPSFSTGVRGGDVVSYASQFLGNPYVLGGNSLTNGTDCSYFVMAVYQNFGISLPRTSYALQSSGKPVSYENAQPGDIICYPGHVAIYVGNGRIIHASTPSTGICYGNATYRTITTVRRVL